MEYLGIYDKDGIYTGKCITRGGDSILKNDEYIKLVTVWIKSKDKFLFQKINSEKGGEYAVTGGHVVEDNRPSKQIIKRCKEELNIDLNPNKLWLLGSIVQHHAINVAFYYEDNSLLNQDISFKEETVDEIVWLSKEEIEELISKKLVRQSTFKQYASFIRHKN